MTKIVEEIAGRVRSLSESEHEEFLSWLEEYEAERQDDWDKEIAQDAQDGGRLSSVLERVRADIASGKTRPLDEVIDNS
jgi:phage shock protein A